MINSVYQLVYPRAFSVKYSDVDIENDVIVKPRYMAICHADQRYYLGQREASVLRKKLPMALIHECCGEVVYDKSGSFKVGQNVVMIPNVPGNVRTGEYENYAQGAKFLSSGFDGFMREFVAMPSDRLVAFENVPLQTAAICEFVSVGMHAVNRFNLCSHKYRNRIAIWGDGSLSYVVSCILKNTYKNSKIIVIGKNKTKLSYFSFADETYLSDELPDKLQIDHAFECVGGNGSFYAINDIVRHINPQGTAVLLGVSEEKIGINTRDILEKGLTLIGCSRSGKIDFENAVDFLKNSNFQRRLSAIIYEAGSIGSIDDIHRAFAEDAGTMFKTVFEWKL